MRRFRDLPINRKLTTVILVTSGAALLLVGIAVIATEWFLSRHAMAQTLVVRADLLSRFATAPLSFHRDEDLEEVNKTLSALEADSQMLAACLYDRDQRFFGEYLRSGKQQSLPAQPPADGAHFLPDYLEVSYPVMMDQKRIGTLYLRGDYQRIYNQIQAHAGIVVLVLLVVAAMTFAISPRLRRPIADPILTLAGVARQVAEKKEYSARAVKQSEDETGVLTDAFNQMLSEIEVAQSSLVKTNQSMQTEIVERKHAEESLRKSEAQLQTIVESLDEGVIVSDLDGQILHFNRAAVDLHGYASLGESLRHLRDFADTFELSGMDGTVWPLDQWPLVRVLRGEKLHDLEVRIRRINADWQRVFSYGGTLVRDAGGQPLMAVVTLNDITEQKRAAEEIRQLNSELEQRVVERTAQLQAANKELESFSYSVSHDLRAPLRSIDGFSQAILEDYAENLGDEGKSALQRVRAATQRMGQLIDDMLNLSRVTRSEIRHETVDLSTVAKAVAAELQRNQPDRSVEFVIAENCKIHGDARLLRVVLDNLIGNAWKFTGKTEQPRIEFGVTPQGEYFVRDNGAGFDMSYAEKLFGAFQRLHATDEFAGTGIGLATVQRIIHRHGGKVRAEAAVGQGATFFFTIPTHAASLQQAA